MLAGQMHLVHEQQWDCFESIKMKSADYKYRTDIVIQLKTVFRTYPFILC
jgi:hypothetical protein